MSLDRILPEFRKKLNTAMIITHFPKTFVFVQMEDIGILEILGNFAMIQMDIKRECSF